MYKVSELNLQDATLEEIWEIKKQIYKEDKDCSLLESLKRTHNVTKQIIKDKKLDKKLVTV